MFSSTISFIKKHKQHLPAVALVVGLVWDSVTLGRPDQLYGNLVLLSYLTLAGVCIALTTRREYLKKPQSLWLPIITQFSFGNLAGGLLVLYIGSATLVGNWPFLLILVGLLLGNEIFKARYLRIRFNTVVYYILVLLYLILAVPVVFRSIEPWTFLVSIGLSLAFIFAFIFVLKIIAKKVLEKSSHIITPSIVSIAVAFGFLYYTNLIPPVPLSVEDIGVFHSVERVNGDYNVAYEKGEWYEFWRDSDTTIYLEQSGTASCFSSIFAPADLTTPVDYVWEKYDTSAKAWEEVSRFNFPIIGGRNTGYRGYSQKSVSEGRWRCSVETKRGALLGRAAFEVKTGEAPALTLESR